jgi:hypothetical protein
MQPLGHLRTHGEPAGVLPRHPASTGAVGIAAAHPDRLAIPQLQSFRRQGHQARDAESREEVIFDLRDRSSVRFRTVVRRRCLRPEPLEQHTANGKAAMVDVTRSGAGRTIVRFTNGPLAWPGLRLRSRGSIQSGLRSLGPGHQNHQSARREIQQRAGRRVRLPVIHSARQSGWAVIWVALADERHDFNSRHRLGWRNESCRPGLSRNAPRYFQHARGYGRRPRYCGARQLRGSFRVPE